MDKHRVPQSNSKNEISVSHIGSVCFDLPIKIVFKTRLGIPSLNLIHKLQFDKTTDFKSIKIKIPERNLRIMKQSPSVIQIEGFENMH